MAGYAAREGAATGTLDELAVSCLALEANGERFALIAIDLIGVDAAMTGAIATGTGLAPESVALCASHTHSGPAGVLMRLHPADQTAVDAALRSRVTSTCVRVVHEALEALVDAELSLAQTSIEGIAANRNRPDGPFDPAVSVISARTLAGTPIATVVHFACHPTILPASSRLISAEFPGSVRRNLPFDQFGVVLFVNGAAGDVSTRFTRQSQDVAEVERVGSTIAAAVISADRPVNLAPRIVATCRVGDIRLRTRRDIETALADASRAADRLDRESLSPAQRRIEETRAQGVELLTQMLSTMDTLPSSVPVCTWRLGELTLTGFPGELFASLGAALIAGHEPSLILGYTNGYHGYFADREAYANGTYEALASPYAAGASEELIAWLRNEVPA